MLPFNADTVLVATWDMFAHSDVAEVCIIIVTPSKQSGVISRIQTLPCIPVIPCLNIMFSFSLNKFVIMCLYNNYNI